MQIRLAVDSKAQQGARGDPLLLWDRSLDSIPHTLLCLGTNKAHLLSIMTSPELTLANCLPSPRVIFLEEQLCRV